MRNENRGDFFAKEENELPIKTKRLPSPMFDMGTMPYIEMLGTAE